MREAETWRRKALSIVEPLAESDPSNYYFQVGLSASLERVGEALSTQDEFDAAAAFFERSLEIVQRLTDADPKRGHARVWCDLADTLGKVAKFEERREDVAEARAKFEQALEILRDLHSEKRLTHKQEEQLAEFEGALEVLGAGES